MPFPRLFAPLLLCLLTSLSHPCLAADSYKGRPYGEKPLAIPGTIEARYYDVAPGNVNGIAYNRKGTARSGPERTTGDCIGLGRIDSSHVSVDGQKETPGGIYVGWTDVGDWWNYTVQVGQDGTYNVGAKLAAGARGAKLSVTFLPLNPPGAPITTGPVEIPTTAGRQPGVEVYHVWETLPKLAQVRLARGLYVMTVKVEAVAGMNIADYTVTAAR
ncbi:MAG TPA: hypothetical protein VHY22_12240 [Chthoniobacteraceae bacterium]|jgi:hypothetical protein|nr:hypothetical protein [Chthoniobacteraceae bacterium]